MDRTGQKIWACLLSILMVISTLAFVGTATATQPEVVPNESGGDGVPDVQVTGLRADVPVVYLDQNNRLVLSVFNQGNTTALKVTVNVTDIVPKVSEELISTEHFGALKPGMDKTCFIDWTPKIRGIHYIKVGIKCEYITHNSPAELVETPPTILSAGFPVSPRGTLERWDTPDLRTIDTGEIRERTGTSTDPLTIEVIDGDLIVQGPVGGNPGGILKLNEYVTLVMIQDVAWPNPIYGIDINAGGKFIINSPSRSTNIQSSSGALFNTYPFLNSGTVDFLGTNVVYTYGPKDIFGNPTGPGGIQNMDGSTCIIDNCKLLEADTHSLYIDGADTNVQVKGTGTIIGSENAYSEQAKGHGIFVNGATPVIEDVIVGFQKQDGIHIENSISPTCAVPAPYLQYYSSSVYDYMLPTLPNYVESINP